MLWKLNKYSINSIAVQTRTNKEFVNKSISKYRRGVKALWKDNQKKCKVKRKEKTVKYIEMIKDFCSSLHNQPITIRKIKSYLLASNLDKGEPCVTTIGSILRKELGMSYKILHKWHKKVMTTEHANSFAKSLLIQFKLINQDYEIIYLDEFSFSSRK